ncbi:phage holin family protein [Burkholderia gladioli]|uniref:phage holin family protein n=1 Tax=Burkholderia gladioli TaxID=28095 RepID=UPI00164041B0|nr:phage holin family protein [Burkholderia gladioli]
MEQVTAAGHSIENRHDLTHRKDGARHRFHIAWAAWAIVAVSGGAGIDLLLHARTAGFFQAALAVLLAVLVYLARGDVAHLLRSKQA